jgi:hypothetical protein
MPERDRGVSGASPTPGGPVAAGAAVPSFRKEKMMSFESASLEGLMRRKERTMTTTMTAIREIDRDELAGVDGGYHGGPIHTPIPHPIDPPIHGGPIHTPICPPWPLPPHRRWDIGPVPLVPPV